MGELPTHFRETKDVYTVFLGILGIERESTVFIKIVLWLIKHNVMFWSESDDRLELFFNCLVRQLKVVCWTQQIIAQLLTVRSPL